MRSFFSCVELSHKMPSCWRAQWLFNQYRSVWAEVRLLQQKDFYIDLNEQTFPTVYKADPIMA